MTAGERNDDECPTRISHPVPGRVSPASGNQPSQGVRSGSGRVDQKPMPQGKHSRLQTRLSSELNQILEPPRLGSAFTELRCTVAGRSLLPDIAVFAWERIPLTEAGEVENQKLIYPDWGIEILSPDQRPTRVINNLLFWLNQGTELGWLVEPEERSVIVFQPN